MRLVIVPDTLRAAINAALDAAYKDAPDAAIDREAHYQSLLDYYDEHGRLPDFSLVRSGP